ncbi:MAG TPA: M3 family metallopeptidase, partial [Gammaproteobacteria bacterium]|nr:M3 family metallopeptidase [Gammaproteobacteria bacterium]
YHSLAGTAVFRDFVEFPSQLLEHWLATPELLSRFARHHQTGQPMPPQLRAKIESASTFNQGFETVEYLSAAMIDMKLHLAGARPVDPADFEREELAKLGMPREIVMRHRMPQFTHVFSSDSYAAGYYSYLWADTLTADAFEAFLDGEGAYDETLAGKLYTHIFSTGNAIDPAESYRRFRGRDANYEALMRKRGFAVDRSARGHAARASGGL